MARGYKLSHKLGLNPYITLSDKYPSAYIWSETTAHILNPVAGLVDPETNAASVVIMLEHGDNRFLFTGDIDSGVEAEILTSGQSVAADVLKVAHHGSQYSSSEEFLSAVLPENAVISVGDNSYGHPADETLARLSAVGAQIWRTDFDGTVFVDSDGFSYSISSENRRFSLCLPLVTHGLQTEATSGPRYLVILPQAQHETLQKARQEQ